MNRFVAGESRSQSYLWDAPVLPEVLKRSTYNNHPFATLMKVKLGQGDITSGGTLYKPVYLVRSGHAH